MNESIEFNLKEEHQICNCNKCKDIRRVKRNEIKGLLEKIFISSNWEKEDGDVYETIRSDLSCLYFDILESEIYEFPNGEDYGLDIIEEWTDEEFEVMYKKFSKLVGRLKNIEDLKFIDQSLMKLLRVINNTVRLNKIEIELNKDGFKLIDDWRFDFYLDQIWELKDSIVSRIVKGV